MEITRKIVTIDENGVHPDPVHLSKGQGDQMGWKSDSEVTIEFKPNPFENGPTFHVVPPAVTHSGKIDDEAELGEYNYTVTAAGSGESTDPKVFIDP